jgi:hypothetical protein
MAIYVSSARGEASLVMVGSTAALIIGMPVMASTKGKMALCGAI